MQFSSRVMETTRKVISPMLRDELKRELCHELIRDKFLGIEPLKGEERQRIYQKVDEMTIDQVEDLYTQLFPMPESYGNT